MILENYIFWAGSFIGMLGTWLISKHDKIGFLFYIVSNPILIFYGYVTASPAIMILFIFNTVFAVKGWFADGGW